MKKVKRSITSNSKISEKQPATDEGFVCSTGSLIHDVEVGRVEAESGSWQAISDKVDPQKLDGNKGFRHAESGSQENTARREGGK